MPSSPHLRDKATTDSQRRLIEQALEALRADNRILAAWLVGSFATGVADAFSDVDLQVCVDDSELEGMASEWRPLIETFMPVVMSLPYPPPTVGGFAISPDWMHVDLVVNGTSATRRGLVDARILFDKGCVVGPVSVSQRSGDGRPYFPPCAAEMFFYQLGNLVVVVGRNEPLLGMNGFVLLRDMWVMPLLLAERGVRAAGGKKRFNPFLSEEQRRELESLPAIAPTLDSVIEGYKRLAQLFIPRARALAAATNTMWPRALEEATVAHVERELGITLDVQAATTPD